MNMKDHILAALREQFERWEELLASLSNEQIDAPHFDLNWSIMDVCRIYGVGSRFPLHGWKVVCLTRNLSFPAGLWN